MSVTFEELFDNHTESIGISPSAQIHYLATTDDSETEAAILTEADSSIPTVYNGLPRTGITIDKRVNETQWTLAVTYEFDRGVGYSSYTFDTGGGRQHITQSIQTRGAYGPQASSAVMGAIGYDGENVNGVDIMVPTYNFTETHYFADTLITPAYKLTLFSITGCVNNDMFRGFAPGELLFLGASGSKRGNDLWEIQYRFSGSPNQVGIVVGDITGISKYGWDYMWVQYADDVDGTTQQIYKKPVAAYVEQVYPAAIFANLGI